MIPKTEEEIRSLRVSGQMLSQILQWLAPQTVPGITTKELADLAAKELKNLGGEAPFLGFQGYPDVICISVNDEIVHGIPGPRVIEEGDIVGLDFGVKIDNMITDGAITVEVGRVTKDAHRLVEATRQSLLAGIDQVRAGCHVGDIAAAVQARLERDKLGIVEDLAGHGVGHALHEEPWIPNFGRKGDGPVLKAGMTVAIEPMATLGKKDVAWGADGWTIATADGSLGAHFEHTVLVTESGAEILTA